MRARRWCSEFQTKHANADVGLPDLVDSSGNVIRVESPGTYLGALQVVLLGVQAEPIEPRLTGGGGSVDRAEGSDVNALIGAPRGADILLRPYRI